MQGVLPACEGGLKAGFPRFKSRSRFRSITFPAYGDGCRLLPSGKLKIQGAGHIKVKSHRLVEGTIKTVTVKREADRWFVCLSVECELARLPASAQAIGLDAGLAVFVTLSAGG